MSEFKPLENMLHEDELAAIGENPYTYDCLIDHISECYAELTRLSRPLTEGMIREALPKGLTMAVLDELMKDEFCGEECEPFIYHPDEGEGEEFCSAWEQGCRLYDFCTGDDEGHSIMYRMAKFAKAVMTLLTALLKGDG